MGIIDMIESCVNNNNDGYGANAQNTNIYNHSAENSRNFFNF